MTGTEGFGMVTMGTGLAGVNVTPAAADTAVASVVGVAPGFAWAARSPSDAANTAVAFSTTVDPVMRGAG